MDSSPASDRPFRWEAFEPGAADEPYTTTRAAVGFVLRPVRAWEHRTAQTLENADPYCWGEFSTFVKDLVTQLSYAVVFAPNPRASPHNRKVTGINVGDFGEWLWIHGVGECDKVLDWLWQFFRARLANRLQAALSAGGDTVAAEMCDGLAEWFRLRTTEIESPSVRDLPLPSSIRGPGFEKALADLNAWVERNPTAPIEVHDPLLNASISYGSLSAGYRELRERKGLNGYVEEAWGRFVSAIDDAKARAYASAPAPSEPVPSTTEDGSQTDAPKLGGYFAPEYAASFADAYEKAPASFRGRGRGGFGALRKAAGRTKGEEETVKRQIGYKALPREEKSFERFIALLFASLGREVPE